MNDIVTFPIVEEFYSIQGEGFNTGKPAYFVRFGGCNISCGWCDIKESWDASKHPKISIDDILNKIKAHKAHAVVITGGEPLMHNLTEICQKLHERGIERYLETSGTYELSGNWTWICLSPKQHHPPIDSIYNHANELKVVIDKRLNFSWAESCAAKVSDSCHLYIQPEWGAYNSIIAPIVEYIKEHPRWRISLQSHKFMKIP